MRVWGWGMGEVEMKCLKLVNAYVYYFELSEYDTSFCWRWLSAAPRRIPSIMEKSVIARNATVVATSGPRTGVHVSSVRPSESGYRTHNAKLAILPRRFATPDASTKAYTWTIHTCFCTRISPS